MTTPPPVSEERLSGGPCEVPLHEQLESIPKDARLTWTDLDGVKATHFVPIGMLAHRAAATIAALRKEVDGLLQLQQDGWQLVCESSLARVTKERDELRRDALRYRWLRYGDNDEQVLRVYDSTQNKHRAFDSRHDGCFLPRMTQLDEAIDVAMPTSVPHE